jgi:hypothetical protein
MNHIKEDFKQMTAYERRKLQVDFMRFIATLGAPFVIIIFGHLAKTTLGW